jgi:hypothetical protein
MNPADSEPRPQAADPIGEVEAGPANDEPEPALPGTLFVLMLFLAAVVGLWGTVYWMLLTR